MKLMRWAMCLAAFAVIGGTAVAEDVDVQALQAKLAAQEARLNDLQAKIYGSACEESGVVAEGITSIRKNATVTIGGTVNTRYQYFRGKVESKYTNANGALASADGSRRVISRTSMGDLGIADAKLEGKIDVSEHFDAYFKFDLQNDKNTHPNVGAAQNYWVRWKNVCNTGFGLLVGRDGLKHGGIQPYGRWDSWGKNISDMGGNSWGGNKFWGNGAASGMALASGTPVRTTVWNNSRTTQITPYWENACGTFKAEVSLFQAVQDAGVERSSLRTRADGSTYRYYDRINSGWGSFSARVTWKPIDGLKIVGSVINLNADNDNGRWGYPTGSGWAASTIDTSDNNFGTYIGFEYRPAFFSRLNVFASWNHSWNDGWVKDQDSDTITAGFGFNILDNLTFYAYGEYLRAKSDRVGNAVAAIHKGTGWANEIGLKYTLPYGVWIDAGWRHEKMEYKNRAGDKHSKLTADNFYTTLGFDF